MSLPCPSCLNPCLCVLPGGFLCAVCTDSFGDELEFVELFVEVGGLDFFRDCPFEAQPVVVINESDLPTGAVIEGECTNALEVVFPDPDYRSPPGVSRPPSLPSIPGGSEGG